MERLVDKPLAGRRIAVTRARHQARTLADRIEEFGGEIIEFPTVEIRPVPFMVDHSAAYDWIVFTSANAARTFAQGLPAAPAATFPRAKVCVVGPATAKAARDSGFRVDLQPENFIAEGVLEAFWAHDVRGKRFLLPRANIARDFLPNVLRESGANVTEIVVYETRCPNVTDADVETFIAKKPDAVMFTSSSTAANFAAILGRDRIRQSLSGTIFASIGPETTKSARAAGVHISVEAERHDVGGLVAALVRWAQGEALN